ncbi:MAG: hypothetical protein L3J68_04575 [Thermoplasmata archaeon]|nr:hypothetical protein [Thermoplasmata archaeon]
MKNLDAHRIARTPTQPVRRRPQPRVRNIGELRLPLAGPYRPRARLYLFPDGRLLWYVRLWEVDRPVSHLVRTETLRTFARVNALRSTLAEIEALHRRGLAEASRASR